MRLNVLILKRSDLYEHEQRTGDQHVWLEQTFFSTYFHVKLIPSQMCLNMLLLLVTLHFPVLHVHIMRTVMTVLAR